MLKLFDNSFFKFFFGFVGILFASLAIILIVQYIEGTNSAPVGIPLQATQNQ